MDREKPDKRVRTSVFLENSLINQANDYAKTTGSKLSDVIRAALAFGLMQLDDGREMSNLRRDVLKAVRVGDFVRAGEVIDGLESRVAKPSTEQLRDWVNKALERKDFTSARRYLDQLEHYLKDWSATTPDLEELDDALQDQDFDIARKILGALRQRWEERTATPQ